MKKLYWIFAATLFIVGPSLVFAQFSTQVPIFLDAADSSRCIAATTAGLGTLREMSAIGSPADYGFSSIAEVAAATLGRPLPSLSVSASNIVAYDSSKDPSTLFENTDAYFTVESSGVPKACLLMEKVGGNWKILKGGGNAYVVDIEAEIARLKTRQIAREDLFILNIPFFNVTALGKKTPNGAFCWLMRSIPGTSFASDTPIDLRRLYNELRPLVAIVGQGVR
jgi:hypothetical protein